MSALVFGAICFVLGLSIVSENRKRRRWREAERLSRALFAAAGLRRYR